MSLQIKSVERKPGYFEIAIAGKLDSTTYTQLETQFKTALPSAQAIVLDMTQLEYISSMGLRVIFKATKDMSAKNGHLMMTNMQAPIKKIFEIANAVPEESVFTSVEEADRYYTAMQDKVRREQQA